VKILRKYRGYDLKGPNSPYRTERIAYWTWTYLRHPSWMFNRPVVTRLADDSIVSPLWVYGNFDAPAYSGVQFYNGVNIEGDARSLRRLAALLIDRAERVERVQELLDIGTLPDLNDMTAFPDGFGPDVAWQDLRLDNAKRAGHWTGA
jgi:hypothetical protein